MHQQVISEQIKRTNKQAKLKSSTKKIIFKNFLSPGDILVMEAAIASLHKSYPGIFETGIDTSANQIYENHPKIKNFNHSEADIIEINYTHSISNCDKTPIHFMQGYCYMLENHLNVKLDCTENRPHIYLSNNEKKWTNQVEEKTKFKGKFWLIAVGYKNCYTVKKPYYRTIQEVIDYFKGKIQFVQIGAIEHNQPILNNVINLVGQTDHRQLIRLAYHAQGALCLESYPNHLMAAFQKPAVVLCSGFLPINWISYPTAKYISLIGTLPCCQLKPCWKSRIVPLNDGDDKDNSLCHLPIFGDDPTARCMYKIESINIIKEIENYYNGGILSY